MPVGVVVITVSISLGSANMYLMGFMMCKQDDL